LKKKQWPNKKMQDGDSKDVSYHITKCSNYLKNRLKDSKNQSLESEKSYITGLKFHRNCEKPSKNRIYLCLIEPDNKFDENAIAVIASQVRIGYVPREMSEVFCPRLKADPNLVLLCYCVGGTTEVSSQCFYNLFSINFPKNASDAAGSLEECVLCFEKAKLNRKNVPCSCRIYCDKCINTVGPKSCLVCKEAIVKFE
jgi:hypothetical protein